MSQSDFVSRGQALVGAGQFQEAVKVCRLGLLGRPTTVEGRVVLGQALLALKRYDEVLAEMRVALELDHASVPAQVLKGEALLRKGDPHAALDVLQRAKLQMPSEPRIGSLLAEAKRGAGRPTTTAGHPAVGFLSDNAEDTRHYPNHGADEEDTSDDADDDPGQSAAYTRPTSLSAPGARKRTPRPQPIPEATPPPAVLAVGDRSGTVEVDPDLDGVELEGEDDFADVAAPPRTRNAKLPPPGGARGQVVRAGAAPQTIAGRAPAPGFNTSSPIPKRPRMRGKPNAEISTVELEDDEMIEVQEPARNPSSASEVRKAVSMPAGPLGGRATQHEAAVPPPPQLAQMIANAPHVMQMQQQPQPQHNPYAGRPNPIAAALPTMAAPMPQPMQRQAPPPTDSHVLPLHLQNPAAIRPTMAVPVPQPPPQMMMPQPMPMDYGGQQQAAWAQATVAAVPNGAPSPQQLAMGMAETMPPSVAQMLEPSQSSKALKTGMRKTRSRLTIVIWFVIGGLVIGGGVFAGFQIRNMRLQKQITEAREQAITLAKADTWKGWIGARDRLAGIAQAAGTLDNVAALARARALVAYEFGDNLADAKAAYDVVRNESALEVELAGAYIALAQNDVPGARAAAERALKLSPEDPSALYVSGQAAMLGGDHAGAIKSLKAAVDREARPIYAIALARAYADGSSYTEALDAIEKALVASPDHPGALIERAQLLTASGQIGARTNAVRADLQRIIAEGGKPPADQPRGVSPTQVAFTHLALARVDYLRGDVAAVNSNLKLALVFNVDDQRFAEEVVETFYAVGELDRVRGAADLALKEWSQSRRIRIALARSLIAQGKPDDALAALGELKDLPKALAVRGQAQLAAKDLDAARASFDAALKKQPSLEIALVGRAWVDIESEDVAGARKRIEKAATAPNASAALATVYAATLRMSNDPAAREQAKAVLEKAVNGPASLDLARAQLELARISRDLGEYPRAKTLFAESSRLGNREARLEHGILLVELGDTGGGRDTLDALLKITDKPSAMLLLQTARAKMLVGEHAAADQLLAQADKAPGVVRWMYQRERGRLELRKGHYSGAAIALTAAFEGCGDDPETFTLAADVAAAEPEQAKLAETVKSLAAKRLAGKPEGFIVTGKLLFSKGDEASKAFETARELLKTIKAPRRREAQAELGRAIVRYHLEEDRAALDAFDYVITLDPSLYEAYLYLADINKEKDRKTALAHAKDAIKYNPDLVEGYEMVGAIAAKLGDRKLLEESVRKLNELAPNSERLKELRRL